MIQKIRLTASVKVSFKNETFRREPIETLIKQERFFCWCRLARKKTRNYKPYFK